VKPPATGDGGQKILLIRLNAISSQAYALAKFASGDKSGMGFQLHTRQIDRVVVVEAVGRLTLIDGRTQLRDLIHVFTGEGAKKFILNLARVEFIDSYGIGELARCCSIVRRTGGEMKLASVNEKVLVVLEISRLNTLFEIYSGQDGALQAFGQPV
jgi:anti-sigma B factor antagonist